MLKLNEALIDVAELLDGENIPYMVIGGLANLIWGETRNTDDVDLAVWIDFEDVGSLISKLRERYSFRVDDPETFARNSHMLPLVTKKGIGIDLVLGELPYQRTAIERAIKIRVLGKELPFCRPEDFVIMKTVSYREKDLDDVRKLLWRRMSDLDTEYIERSLRELGDIVEDESIPERWYEVRDEALELEKRRQKDENS